MSETSEENMSCNSNKVLPPLTKRNELNSTQFPVDYSSKYIPQNKSALHGFSYKNDILVKSGSLTFQGKHCRECW